MTIGPLSFTLNTNDDTEGSILIPFQALSLMTLAYLHPGTIH